MALLRFHDEDEYWPEFGTAVIRDATSATGWWQDFQSLALDEHTGPLFGTVARAGEGWLQLYAGDGGHRVRVEVHDRPGAVPDEPWLDIMQTPYSSATGAVGLTTMTTGPGYYGVMESDERRLQSASSSSASLLPSSVRIRQASVSDARAASGSPVAAWACRDV